MCKNVHLLCISRYQCGTVCSMWYHTHPKNVKQNIIHYAKNRSIAHHLRPQEGCNKG